MDLQWFPGKPNQLLTWAQEINLYRIDDINSEDPQLPTAMKISPTKSASLLSKLNELQYPKVVDAYPGNDADGMIAVGLGNGNVVLTSFGSTIISKEFVPKTQRQINSLCWNKFTSHYLAACFEKGRSEYAVAVWDITSSSKCVNGFHSDALRPTVELGNSETAHSVAWLQPKTLLVGMNSKHLKVFDLRDSQAKLERTAATKAVNGISLDTNFKVASFAENQVCVWDVRNFDKPFVVLNHSRPISKIGWCPTRSGLLACLEKESDYVQLHDVHHATLSSEDGLEPAVLERRLTPAVSIAPTTHRPGTFISSFAWHPTDENLLTTAYINGVIWNSTVYERITVNWSPLSKLGWSSGKKLIRYVDKNDEPYRVLDDVSVKIRDRALSKYGLQPTLKDNAKLVAEDPVLKHLWEWLDYCRILTEKEKYRVMSICNSNIKFPGVRTVLKMEPTTTTGVVQSSTLKSDMVHNSSFDSHSIGKSYRSEERIFIQQLCGWCEEGAELYPTTPTRHAANLLFHLKLRQAITVLSESGYSIVAMAIAGFTDDKNSLWREQALMNGAHLEDPYIRAIFAFLTDTDGSFEKILFNQGLTVADRVGFACSFLPDAKLVAYIDILTKELTETGDLFGVLLTGMTAHVLPVLQKYLDETGDIQTLSVLAIRTLAHDIPSTPQLSMWIHCYRELLNCWKLWEARTEFDIVKNTHNPSLIPPPEVTISCGFCGKSVLSQAGIGSMSRNAQLFSRFAPATANAKTKLTCCPNCRKPLPRCCICLLSMGTVLGKGPEVLKELEWPGSSPIALSWFSWCQSCRHGGHTIHLKRWFALQLECPVTGCSCKCASLDKVEDFS